MMDCIFLCAYHTLKQYSTRYRRRKEHIRVTNLEMEELAFGKENWGGEQSRRREQDEKLKISKYFVRSDRKEKQIQTGTLEVMKAKRHICI